MAAKSAAQKRKEPPGPGGKDAGLAPKKRPVCICSACQRRSNQVPWGLTVPSKRSDCEPLPEGDACGECQELRQVAFPYLQWPAYCELMATEVASRG